MTRGKLLIAGIGGQGVVYLTTLVTEAACRAGIPVASSEIHGLAQRRGSVVSGVTFGEGVYGFIEEAGADFMIGLEPLESMRNTGFLHRGSRAVIDSRIIPPHGLNTGKVPAPDVGQYLDLLRRNIRQLVANEVYPQSMKPIYTNIYLLGRAVYLDEFPLTPESIEHAIRQVARPALVDETMEAFRLGYNAA